MAEIFISYRKTGVDETHSLYLAEDLRESFGDDAVFRDETSLSLGKFEDQILHHVKSCRTIIAVIGPSWIERIADLHQPLDWVRKELEEGLRLQILMVPVLVGGALLPDKKHLPDSLLSLLTYQSLTIDQRHRKEDVAKLIDSLAQHLGLQKRIRGQVPIPNLSGSWIDTDGVSLSIEHRGDSLRLSLLDIYGQALGHGEGTITGSQLQFSIFRPDLGHGKGTGTASSDGRQISGSVQYGTQRFEALVLRSLSARSLFF